MALEKAAKSSPLREHRGHENFIEVPTETAMKPAPGEATAAAGDSRHSRLDCGKADSGDDEKNSPSDGERATSSEGQDESKKGSVKSAKKETKDEKEARKKQREEERERKRQKEEEERERKRRKKEEQEAKKKAEEEEREMKRKKREEEKERKRQQEQEEKLRKHKKEEERLKKRQEEEEERARKQKEKEERLEKKKQEEEEKIKKQKEREEKLEKKRQEEEEKEMKRREAEEKEKAAKQKAADFMSRFLGKTKAPAHPSGGGDRSDTVAKCEASIKPKPDAMDDAASTTNGPADRPHDASAACTTISKRSKLFLPPPASSLLNTILPTPLFSPVNIGAMDKQLADYWGELAVYSAKADGQVNAAVTQSESTDVGRSNAAGEKDGELNNHGTMLPHSDGTAQPGCTNDTHNVTGNAAPAGNFLEAFQSFCKQARLGQAARVKLARADLSGRSSGNWRLRRLPKQGDSGTKRPGSGGAGAPTEHSPGSRAKAKENEEDNEEEDDELWMLMGSTAGPASPDQDADDEVQLGREKPGSGADGLSLKEGGVKKRLLRKKLLQFHDNMRPAYFGTYSTTSTAVGPRRPFAKEPVLDYEVDSDDEWEDMEEDLGESLSDSEGEDEETPDVAHGRGTDGDEEDEEEDGFVVPDGYLSDDEGVEQNGAKPKAGNEEAVAKGGSGGGDSAPSVAQGDAAQDARLDKGQSSTSRRWRKLQLLDKAVQRALRCGRPVIISFLNTDLVGLTEPGAPSTGEAATGTADSARAYESNALRQEGTVAEGGKEQAGPTSDVAVGPSKDVGGTAPSMAAGCALGPETPARCPATDAHGAPELQAQAVPGEAASKAAALAQLEYLQALTMEVLTTEVCASVPVAPVTPSAEERPQGGPAKKQRTKQQKESTQQQAQVAGPAPGKGSSPALAPAKPPLAAASPGSGLNGGTPVLAAAFAQLPDAVRRPFPKGKRSTATPPFSPAMPLTPAQDQASKQVSSASGSPVSPVRLEALMAAGLTPQQQAAAKPITAFFVKHAQGAEAPSCPEGC